MTRLDHLLTCLAEECMEVAQRATKALRFGINETQPGLPGAGTNAQRLVYEFNDLLAVYRKLKCCGGAEGMLQFPSARETAIADKEAKVEKFLEYSAIQGRLTTDK